MADWMQRTEILLGEEKTQRLGNAKVLIAGVGGVGSWAAEMLCRAGVGCIVLIDADTVEETNINRQLPALHSTIGKPKAEVVAERLRDINPEIKLTVMVGYLNELNIKPLLDSTRFDFIVDAIDSIKPKVSLIKEAWEHDNKIISSMGAGAKSDITTIHYADLWETNHCSLSKRLRRLLTDMRMVHGLPVVYSNEEVDRCAIQAATEYGKNNKPAIGTVSYFTATFGNYLAAYVIKNL